MRLPPKSWNAEFFFLLQSPKSIGEMQENCGVKLCFSTATVHHWSPRIKTTVRIGTLIHSWRVDQEPQNMVKSQLFHRSQYSFHQIPGTPTSPLASKDIWNFYHVFILNPSHLHLEHPINESMMNVGNFHKIIIIMISRDIYSHHSYLCGLSFLWLSFNCNYHDF